MWKSLKKWGSRRKTDQDVAGYNYSVSKEDRM
jgi:hypothetical protein